MEGGYLNNLSYDSDHRNRHQDKEHYVNPLQETEASETKISMSEASKQRERPIHTRTRLNSYEQAHVSRDMLEQMQRSYIMASTGPGSSHNDLFIDETSVAKKTTLRWIAAGLITILLLILIITVGMAVLLAFLFFQNELRFGSPSMAQVALSENLNSVMQDIDFLFDEIQRLEENMNVSNDVIFASNEAISILSNLLLITTTKNLTTIEVMNTLVNQLNQLTVSTQNNFSDSASQLSTIQDELHALDRKVSSLERQLRAAQNDVTDSVNSLQTTINNITNRLSFPVNLYQNCRQDTSSCNITTFRDTRLFCSTRALVINMEVSIYYVLRLAFHHNIIMVYSVREWLRHSF